MSRSRANKYQQVSKNEQRQEYRNFRVVFMYCILIILLPVASFFGSKYFLFDGLLKLDPVTSNIYSAVSAVIALHIALGLYIYRAYFDNGGASAAPSPVASGYQKLPRKQD
ncbi:vacuolar ATPase assembly integral membrane protein VMA21 homolog [Uranotaenia lowii]|uniref:vacuolar ATPase assembly integral membrane protein VMA21 homolog n=1 Tax=Uranotaenia lowii TaxID=190385 RepID=UPI00247A351A|nr:vacuolar ATPase assembly integral membrane protein VMA21 homolog [Uranotaenia lowii]